MKKSLTFFLAIGAVAILLPACKKDAPIASSQTSQGQAVAQGNSDYGVGAAYQVELSANLSGTQGGGVWLWIGLYPNWQGDYSGSDCGHGGQGAASDKGNVTWHYSGSNHEWITISGVMLNGLGGFPTTITVPSKYGHYTGTLGSYLTLPPFIPSSAGNSQLQVAP